MITEEELNFDLDGLKELQEKRLATISRLEEAITAEEAVYAERAGIISVLENEPEQTEIITNDLKKLYDEQRKRWSNVETIRATIEEERAAMKHEMEIIEALEKNDGE